MTPKACPSCIKKFSPSEARLKIAKAGSFKRKSDSRRIQRFRCLRCRRNFSNATGHPAFGQNKRQMNERLRKLLCSGVSLRRAAILLHVSRTTVSRKFNFLGSQAKQKLRISNLAFPKIDEVQFDDQETFEHTKFKPLSITLAVDSKSRRILAFEVSKMPAKGLLASRALKKYGIRSDGRPTARRKLFETLKPLVDPHATFKSDENPHYPKDLRLAFPQSNHVAFKGERGSIVGQGELKKIRFDPLFSLNHTCAMTRANMNRLFRRTWCTTKNPERLEDHFAIYAVYHNFRIAAANRRAAR